MMMQAKKMVLVLMIALTVIPHSSLLAQDVTGRWKGRIEPTNHSAEIELELQRAGAAWTAELTYRAGPDGSSSIGRGAKPASFCATAEKLRLIATPIRMPITIRPM